MKTQKKQVRNGASIRSSKTTQVSPNQQAVLNRDAIKSMKALTSLHSIQIDQLRQRSLTNRRNDKLLIEGLVKVVLAQHVQNEMILEAFKRLLVGSSAMLTAVETAATELGANPVSGEALFAALSMLNDGQPSQGNAGEILTTLEESLSITPALVPAWQETLAKVEKSLDPANPWISKKLPTAVESKGTGKPVAIKPEPNEATKAAIEAGLM